MAIQPALFLALVAAASAAADSANATGCQFAEPPELPSYWEPSCTLEMPGCWADSANVQCRFCDAAGTFGTPCPEAVQAPEPPRPRLRPAPAPAPEMEAAATCTFPLPPRTPYYWDPSCRMGVFGCNADGIHPQCRFCVQRPVDGITCLEPVPNDRCHFPGQQPTTRYYWDNTCSFGQLGCWADGLHPECRWCGQGAYASVPCP